MCFRISPIIALSTFIVFGLQTEAQTTLTLQRALQTAKNNNAHLQAEQLNIGLAQTDIITAKLRSNLVLNNESLQQAAPAQFAPNTNWHNGQNREVLWQLTKTFQVAGQRRHRIAVANRSVSLAAETFAETARDLLRAVGTKWVEVWAAQKKLDMTAIARNNIDTLISTNQIRYKNQVITQTDMIRTELLAKQYAIQYSTKEEELSNARKELQLLLSIQDSLAIDTTAYMLSTPTMALDSLILQSLQNRSDILAARLLINVSDSNIKLQKSLAVPQPEFGLIWNQQNTVPHVGIYAAIGLPFFNRNQGEIRKSYLIKEQAQRGLYAVQSQLQTEIETAHASYRLQQRNLEKFDLLLAQAQSILDNVQYAYLKGGTTLIDFLEAQRSWLDTQQDYYDVLQQYRQSYIQLLYATGLINQLAQ